MVTDAGSIDSIYKTGTSLQHRRHQQRLHKDWKLNQSVAINSEKMSTALKVKLLTQPTDVIYIDLFEGDTTRLLPKITSFLVWIFGFLIFFLDFFKYFKNLEKE